MVAEARKDPEEDADFRENMFPTINLRETGINLQRIMDKRGITPKDIKEFLTAEKYASRFFGCQELKHGWNDICRILLQNESITFCRRIFYAKKSKCSRRFEWKQDSIHS